MLPVAAVAERTGPTALEEEVVQLFHQLRAPVLRYLLSLGLAVQDAEEIAQEVFMALFRHLRHGKSRNNLRGWTSFVLRTIWASGGVKLSAATPNRRKCSRA